MLPMGLCWSPLTLLCLLGILVSSCHGGPEQTPSGSPRDMTGPQCQVYLEVKLSGTKSTLCLDTQNQQALPELYSKLGLSAGKAGHIPDQMLAEKMACSFQNRFSPRVGTNVSNPELHVICQEPPPKAPPTTQRPPVTTAEPTGPLRFRLVEGKEQLRCAGVVEFYKGSAGGSICYNPSNWTKSLGDKICETLNCGAFLDHLDTAAEKTNPGNLKELKPLEILWEVRNPKNGFLGEVFQKQRGCAQNRTLSIICSDFQPKVKSRLRGGSSPCKGRVEVYFEGQWKGLCGTKRNWEEVCHAQHCGSLVSQVDMSATDRMLFCKRENLSHCYTFSQGHPSCKGVMIECQDPNASGPGAGTVMSIILTLILLAILLVVCGPVVYKKLEKKFRQKKQRQWIGPTGVNQNVSFHRNHTVTVRSQAENPRASNVENEYSQPPRHSRLSAYPALEGALNRSSNPPDNSSDSDYDLHGAQRL
ncbi:T-cell surface glycoprotein CD5 [Dromiciops gliroides]|uniref:T-cell surface glycoprotein CD5 n=1 Tax=Dromiciops gliroides TaxID=33562 RepID=UPI001CC4493A|nr:T-cell surface glycoprotein CD5 [Dromiciops gliroides]